MRVEPVAETSGSARVVDELLAALGAADDDLRAGRPDASPNARDGAPQQRLAGERA